MVMTGTVQMWGNTRAVRIPKVLAEQAGLEIGTPVRLTPVQGGILIEPVRRRKAYRLSQLLAQCKGRSPHREAIAGPAGKETF